MTEYIQEVYGTAWALIRNPDGSLREATPEELEKIEDRYTPALENAFEVEKPA